MTNLETVCKSSLIKSFLSIIVLTFIAAVTISVNFSTTNTNFLWTKIDSENKVVFAQSDPSSVSPEQLREQAKDFLSTLIELRNQSREDALSSIDQGEDNNISGSNETELTAGQLATDISGHYNNPRYGIMDFVLPSGWYGSEKQWSGDKSISVAMHPGN